MKPRDRSRRVGLFLAFACLLPAGPAAALTLRAAGHIQSRYSDGEESLDEIAARAEGKGLDAVIFTDTLDADTEYGLPPLRRLLRWRHSRPSILSSGARRYLDHIRGLRRRHPGLLIIPGAEVTAYYRWEGDPWRGLTLADWHRHLIVFGLEDPDDYDLMPVPGRGGGRPATGLILLGAGLAGTAACLWAGRKRRLAVVLACLAAAVLADGWRARLFLESPYLGETPWMPYQRVIDHAAGRGGISFWAHPDAPNWSRPQRVSGRVWMRTNPYPEALLRTSGHQGFAAVFEGLRRTGVPGAQWDQALGDYIAGRRPEPAWAFGELDYRKRGPGLDVDTVQMVIEAEERSIPAALRSLRAGRFYVVFKATGPAAVLREWSLAGPGGAQAFSGQTLQGGCRPLVRVELAYAGGGVRRVELALIRDGREIFRRDSRLPARWDFTDSENASPRSFYRAVIRDDRYGKIVTNPIFCRTPG